MLDNNMTLLSLKPYITVTHGRGNNAIMKPPFCMLLYITRARTLPRDNLAMV